MNNKTMGSNPDRPQLTLMSREKIEMIHDASMKILAHTGASVRLPEAVALLADAGCEVGKDDLVKIPRRVVEACVDMAPSAITVYDRNGSPALNLEGRNAHFGTGPTIQYVLDPETGARRNSTMDDIARAARIVDALPNIDFAMTMGMSGGINPQSEGLNPLVTDRFDFAAMLQNTTKPLMFSNWSVQGLADCYDMAVAAKGGGAQALRAKPFIMVYCEPTTPLIHDRDPLEIAFFCAERAIPLLNISGPVAGGTAPITPAACLALSNAEFLSGLVIAQLKRKGAPLVYGGSSGPLDMRTGVSVYTGPETWLIHTAIKELANFYQLPDFNTAGASDAKILDQQAAIDYTAGIAQAILVGSNLIHDVGYMESGYTACWEGMVMADEIIDFWKGYLRGIAVNEETLALDLIHKQGPGGSFLAEDHTFEHFRDMWQPRLFDRSDYITWQAAGAQDLGSNLNAKVKEILATHAPQPLDTAVAAQIETILAKAKEQFPLE